MIVNIELLKNDLSKYLHKVKEGDEITITDRNIPIAKIIPLEKPTIRKDLSQWIDKNLPVKTRKKQSRSIDLLRKIRDEE